jgi:D-alanyl-D-alanine carboxypeptidase
LRVKVKMGTVVALALVVVSGVGLYIAYRSQDIAQVKPPVTTGQPFAAATTIAQAPTAAPTAAPPTAAPASQAPQPPAATAAPATQAPQTAAPSEQYRYAGVYEGIAPVVAQSANPYLIVVNRTHALPAAYTPVLAVCVPAYPEKRQMEATAAAAYKRMHDDALAQGVHLVPYSGYRSTTHQKNNFDNKIAFYVNQGYSRTQAVNLAAQSIMPPGCSEHEAGLAMDITTNKVWDIGEFFEDTAEFEWLMAHGAEYGFILRYPKDKTEITLVKYEPWHWRYVGVEEAQKIKASGQCLEEYFRLA